VLLISVLPWLAAMADIAMGRDGLRRVFSISDVNLYFFIAPDVQPAWSTSSYTDMRNELGYGCAPVAANAFISIRAISRPSRAGRMSQGNAWHSCIHRSSGYPGALRGLPAPVLLAPACGALQPRYGAFRTCCH